MRSPFDYENWTLYSAIVKNEILKKRQIVSISNEKEKKLQWFKSFQVTRSNIFTGALVATVDDSLNCTHICLCVHNLNNFQYNTHWKHERTSSTQPTKICFNINSMFPNWTKSCCNSRNYVIQFNVLYVRP